MSNYKYKDVAINTIIESGTRNSTNSSEFHNVYKGLPSTNSTTYNNSKLDHNFNYKMKIDNTTTDLSSICSAYHHKYSSSSESENIPDGVNAYRYFIIGGSGGGGGGGGVGNNSGVQGDGGYGGRGGAGFYNSQNKTNIDRTAVNTFNVTIGNGGVGGISGVAHRSNSSGNRTDGNAGGTGKYGGETNITIGNHKETVGGGGPGGGGGGGWGYQTDSIFAKNNSSNGGIGNSSNPYTMVSNNWDKHYVTDQTGGNGGNGGVNVSDGGSPGNPGENGYAVIVWLYD